MAVATPTPIAFRKRSATCSWTSPAQTAVRTKSSAPAPAESAPNAGRARVVVKVGQADSRPADATGDFHALRRSDGACGEAEYHRDIRFIAGVRGADLASAMRDRGSVAI